MHENILLGFLKANWEVIFSGIGTAIVVALISIWFKSFKTKNKNKETLPNQTVEAGNNSQIVQGGRDVSVGSYNNKLKEKVSDND